MLSENQLKKLLSFAKMIAFDAGQILVSKSKRQNQIMLKGRVDLVTDADLASEKYIIKSILDRFPDHSILAEESDDHKDKKSDFRWIIDPLDGTTNFAHGFPFYCVSVGLEYRETMVAGVVYDPVRDEQFYAHVGGGAFMNRRKISVTDQNKLERSLLATGFPYDIGTSRVNNLTYFSRFAKKARGVRRAGSAALDLCYLACGRFDGFWELKLHPWDTAAATVIVREAEGQVTDFKGRKYSIYDKYLLATNGKIHNQMISILAGKKKA